MADAPVVFTLEEKNAIRHALGYLQVDAVTSISLGVPAASHPMFLVESAMQRVPAAAAGRIRRTLGILEGLEARQVDAVRRFAAVEVEGIKINLGETDMIEKELARWSYNLASDLGVPVNMYAPRFRNSATPNLSQPVYLG